PHADRDCRGAAGAVGDGQDTHARRNGKAARLARAAALERGVMTDHERYRELAGPYALDALEAEQRAPFEAHLAECATCRADVQAFREVAGALAHAAPAATPPPAPSGRIYQLWAIKKGQNPVSVGTFNTAAGGRAIVTLPAPAGLRPDLSAVTEEPAGGSPQPTQQPFLVGAWQGI